MRKQMKLVAILLAALGLMVLENKADAQVYARINIGVRPHCGNGYGNSYGGGYGYARPCPPPAPVVVAPYGGGCYSRPMPRCERPRAYAYGNGYSYRNNGYNRHDNYSRNNDRGYGRRGW